MDPIAASCRTTYKAIHHSGTRPLSGIKLIVLHSTEGGCAFGAARSTAQYFTRDSSGGSAHLVVDDDTCYRTLANEVIPWGAPGANEQGFHIEQCGYARWTTTQWEKHLTMLHRVAYKIALHSKLFGIPLVILDTYAVKAGRRGVTTHAVISKAFPNSAGNHHDPGTGYPMGLVLKLAHHYKEQMS